MKDYCPICSVAYRQDERDALLKHVVAHLDGALMRPMWVNRSARSIQAMSRLDDSKPGPLRGAPTRELNSAREVRDIVLEYAKLLEEL